MAKAHVISCCYLVGKEGEELLHEVAFHYKEGMKDMSGRAPGAASIRGKQKKQKPLSHNMLKTNQCFALYFWCSIIGVHELKPRTEGGYRIAYNKTTGGCGAAMRAMCIGLRFD